MTDPEDRERYLNQICADDESLRKRIEDLLAAHERDSKFLKSAANAEETVELPSLPDATGQQFGPYKLLQKIGEGGFGVVYMAEQKSPIKRRVALKIIKPGMDTHAVVARFEAERQALAMMDHPNIARVLDGGATDSGRPYFVMELVRGVPITEYCDENLLPTEERLRLFITVCQAVQHAHQKGIIHRDVKPSNILVTLHDGQPVVKVIDFGVAKAINQQLTEKTLFTAYGQMVGTPQYMSPEQAEMSGLDVDTRSDIYSLGVLLYELLTGTTPLEADQLRSAGFAEMQRLIREQEPPKPSTRLSSSGDQLTIIAKHRSVDPERLQRQVKGDLDWIVMRALAKDRGRRYDSSSTFGADIHRFLSNEPIEARPPSTPYQLLKLYQRNKALVSGVAVVFVALTIGIAGAIWGIKQVSLKNKLLEEKQAELERANATAQDLIKSKDEVLKHLHDEITGRALSLALTGASEQANRAIADGRAAGADESALAAIAGLAHLYAGNASDAIKILEQATEIDDESISAWSGLWIASLHTGQYDRMSEARRHMGDFRPVTDTEKLFFAQMTRHADPKGTVAVLVEVLERHPTWGAVYSLRGRARINVAKDCYLEPGPLELFEEAIDDFEKAAILTPESEFVLTDYLLALLEASEFARYKSLSNYEEQWMQKAAEISEQLGPPSKISGYASKARTAYLAAIGEQEKLDAIWDAVYVEESAPIWVLAARFFADERMADLRRLLDERGKGRRAVDLLEILYVIETSDNRHKDVIKIYETSFGSMEYAADIDFLALYTLLLLGDEERAKVEAEAMLEKPSVRSGRWGSLVMNYLVEPSDEAEHRLKQLAGPFVREREIAYCTIGMVALARSDREKARECFEEAMKSGFLDTWWYICSFAFRERLDDDWSWPHWISP